MVQQKPFDATLAGLLVLLCWYIYTLHNERRRQTSLKMGGAHNCKALSSAKHCRPKTDSTSELDLTGYANTLGVSLRTGTGLAQGGTMNKIMMDALAKEYLRCVSALKCYQNAFGPLQEDAAEQPDAGESAIAIAGVAVELADEVDPAFAAAPTPRSPMANPPSPDPRRRSYTEAKGNDSKLVLACAGSPGPAGFADRVTVGGSSASSSGCAGHPLHPQTCDDEKAALAQQQHEEAPPRASFGLFGGR
jgi:hypothetical protein